jgi:hypothetical protein
MSHEAHVEIFEAFKDVDKGIVTIPGALGDLVDQIS